MDDILRPFGLERFDAQCPADLRDAADLLEAGRKCGWEGEEPAALRAAAVLIAASIEAAALLGLSTVPS
jgi:hypothetical protein